MTIPVRRVREEDAGAIVALLNEIIRAGRYTAMDDELTIEEQVEFIRGLPERGVYHVAAADETAEILGLQDVLPVTTAGTALGHVGEISTFVSLGAHRQGIGRELSRATFAAARSLGLRKLMAAVRSDNPSAVAFYESQGFRVIGIAREHACVRGRYLDEVLMEKLIAPVTML